MQANLVCIPFILKNIPSDDIRKNDVQELKILVNKKKELIKVPVNSINLKESVKGKLKEIINTSHFHLEQVYTLGEEEYNTDNKIDIIYLAIANIESIKNIDEEYQLVDIDVLDNCIHFDNEPYQFQTKEKIDNNNIEYFHEINAYNISEKKKLLEILISYKHLRSKLDNSDLIFKFLPQYFTLEDVRILYEKLKEVTVDKSNFRKKIMKYCEETNKNTVKKGYRPSKLYTFKVLKGDIWL